LTQENLSRTLFPLGKYTKAEVRQIALDNGYEQLSKKGESQEICFIPDNDYRNFLRTNVPNYEKKYKPGNFVDINGKVLGKHQGFPNYTIGQRKGLGIALGEPMYVVRIDAEKNQVVLGRKEDLLTKTCYARDLNMMKFPDFIDGQTVMAKVRYKSRPGLAHIYHVDESELQTLNLRTQHAVSDDSKGQNTFQHSSFNSQLVRIVFEDPIESITPGQSVVFYCGDNYTDVLAGAILI
jgi:tRNA-specific 2-thiouridylase